MTFFLCALLSFFLCWFFTKIWLSISRRLSVFQVLREEAPLSHQNTKGHVPTLGGIAILLSVLIATSPVWTVRIWVPLGTFLACGLLGLWDDLLKIAGGKNLGLKARHKLAGQMLIGFSLWAALHKTGVNLQVALPYIGEVDLGWFAVPLVVLVLVASSNAVNLTDGLDGLAGGVTATIVAFFLAVSLMLSPDPTVAYFSAALFGALLGFLWFNGFPASVFMGDVGSLALGGALAAMAFQSRLLVWLPIAGGVLVAETLSVILQVVYFKLTGGGRIFKMSPLHHHYELSGIPETQVTLRFWIVSFFLSAVSVLGAIHGF